MSDASPDVPTQRGWYADPTGLPQKRWWDGEQWTEHLHDPERNAYGIDEGSALGARAAVFNNYLWAIALLPVVSFLALTSAETASPLLGWGISIGSVLLAFLDRRQLLRDGLDQPFHWAWAILSPGAYVVGRSVTVRRRTGASLAPMWVWAAIMVVYVLTVFGKVDQAAAAVAALGG
ncbi:DUF2510 domain-containing protein [Cryobacterium tagatosivorans]|uniref:DUF2510 domain-containing protein n=1 Tax=Cryobacterium tagatosivorans TaxID=1259199 RepID=A0A4R8UJ21_9MICO|nr:DUF2510 domain-containing protein [Cryobacterium tagatosivorans]TFB55010.1 DUF2510 domain-containing protein [Cryobacterium tagatosivorans]